MPAPRSLEDLHGQSIAAQDALALAHSILEATDGHLFDLQLREDAVRGVEALGWYLARLDEPDAEDLALVAALNRWMNQGDHYRAPPSDAPDVEPLLLPAAVSLEPVA